MYLGDRELSHDQSENSPSAEMDANRRHAERRVCDSKGYCYISMVGWMDRREKKRRHDDDDLYC